ncbi:pimeloyl-ACP methyl ester carboxylesterase [Cricetibacter osteomyelitidis]|uniref:Pimeloyl-ACP methyl ester carboxylesterase n=1 Tax=Cricetibacter osteomyelitidis TaxID=1521931 RepID=A0A4R2SNT3_9PAST|nr:alpha/beta hydrolase [Cricetibacter osteomyelitidis]TCP90091.1 pimeloyl-ACP methyl ester carboxylesterase [Cricetibacter osteomyelitidis]
MKRLFLTLALCCVSVMSYAEPLRYFGQTAQSYQNIQPYGSHENGRYADVGDTRIYYEIYGSGAPVVVLHGGLVGSIGEMGQLIERLSQDHQVIAVATRGHGKSGIGTAVPSYERKAQDLAAVLAQVTQEPITLVGFSDGAYTGYYFAAQYPDKIHRLIAIGAGEWQKNFRHFSGSFAEFAQLDPQYWQQQLTIRPEPERINDWLADNFAYYNQLEIGKSLFRQVTTPTLLIAGEKDQNAPLDTVIAAYKALPQAQLAIIPNAPHDVLHTNFPIVWQNIRTFLTQLPMEKSK